MQEFLWPISFIAQLTILDTGELVQRSYFCCLLSIFLKAEEQWWGNPNI